MNTGEHFDAIAFLHEHFQTGFRIAFLASHPFITQDPNLRTRTSSTLHLCSPRH